MILLYLLPGRQENVSRDLSSHAEVPRCRREGNDVSAKPLFFEITALPSSSTAFYDEISKVVVT